MCLDIYLIEMYKEDLVLNNVQGLIFHKTQTNQICIQWWSSSSGVLRIVESLFLCHYSQFNTNPNWEYFLGTHLCIK